MATPVEIAVKATGTTTAARSLDQLEGRASKLSGTLKTLAVGGALVAGAALAKFAASSVQAASKAEQSLGATETVYGKYADTVVRASNRAADSVGLSANEYRELANVVGASLQGAGVPLRDTVDLTAKLNKRAADLAATFGGSTRQAIEAVSSLLRGEADPIEQYGVSIKQADVNARLAAQGLDKLEGAGKKQAEMQARLDLLFGKTAKSAGAFARESDTLAGAQQRLDAKVENVQARFGNLLLPVLTDVVNVISRRVVPAAEDLADWLAANQDEITRVAGAVRDGLLPPLQTLGTIVTEVAGFVAELPPGLQALAVQAAAAALILPRLNAALTGAQTTLGGFGANLRDSTTRAAAFGRAAQLAGGVAGVAALTQGVRQSNDGLTILGATLTGAAGGAVFGPWGALVGGAAGALGGLLQTTRATGEAMPTAAEKAEQLAASIDRIAAASGKARREEALRLLQAEGMIGVGNQLGISTQTLIAALTGNAKAAAVVRKEYKGTTDVLRGLQAQKLSKFMIDQGFALRVAKNELEDHRNSLKKWDGKLRETTGHVGDANVKLGKLGNTRPSSKWLDLYGIDLGKAGRKSATEPNRWNSLIRSGTGRARANLDPLRGSLSSQLNALRGTAGTGGSQIGSAVGSGIKTGIDGWIDNIAQSAANAVAAALAAARNRAKAKSPSRETMRLGRDMGEGLRIGLRQSEAKAAKAGKSLVEKFLTASEAGARDLDAALTKILRARGLKDAGIKRAMRSLDDETRKLNANAKAQDQVATSLAKAREKLKAATDASNAYAAALREGVIATGDVTALGLGEEGTATSAGILDQLRDRVADAKRFESLIEQLRGRLNRTSLEQILAKGVEGGLTTAEALVAGGPKVVSEVNTLTAQLTAAGTRLGNDAAKTMHGAGVAAAQGLVNGLAADSRALDKAAKRLAEKLAKAVRKALKIKSPSGVFREIGLQTVRGLEIGLDDTHVRRAGATLAGSLVDGFADPKLTARAAFDASLAGGAGFSPTVLEITAEQLSLLEQGGRIQVRLDAFHGPGGRRLATGTP